MKHYFGNYGMTLEMNTMNDIYEYVKSYTSPEVMEEMDDECFVKEYLKDRIFYELNEENIVKVYDYSKVLYKLFGMNF